MLTVLEGSVTLKVTAACGKYNCDLATSTNPNNGEMRLGALGANQEYIWTVIPTGKQVKLTSANVVTLSDVTVRLTFGDDTLGETRTRLVAAGWLPFPQIGGCTAACWHFP